MNSNMILYEYSGSIQLHKTEQQWLNYEISILIEYLEETKSMEILEIRTHKWKEITKLNNVDTWISEIDGSILLVFITTLEAQLYNAPQSSPSPPWPLKGFTIYRSHYSIYKKP